MTSATFAQAAQSAQIPAPAQDGAFFHLSVRCWLPEMGGKLHGMMKLGKTQKGNDRVSFAAAPTGYDDRANNGDGGYISGRLFSFEATDNGYGHIATQILDCIATGDLLVEVKAQYKPYQYLTDEGEKRTADKWFIVEVNPVSRNAAAPVEQDYDQEFQNVVDQAPKPVVTKVIRKAAKTAAAKA